MKILITSGGSMVAQNIFDGLEGRRKDLEIIAIDSLCNNAVVNRADKILKSPTTNSNQFEEFLLTTLHKTKPQLVIPGRDADVVALSHFAKKYPEWSVAIPVGNPQMAEIFDDKWKSYLYFKENSLPFAKTFHPDDENFMEEILDVSFPLIAKPSVGFGSTSVFFVENQEQINAILDSGKGFVFQELIDPPTGFDQYLADMKRYQQYGIPLFSHLPDDRQISIQYVIGPKEQISNPFISINKMVVGRPERSEKLERIKVAEIGNRIAQSVVKSGWKGSLNIQGRLKENVFLVTEWAGRLTGTTSARVRMGWDEVGMLIKGFTGYEIPEIPFKEIRIVERALSDYSIPPAINTLI